jgi:hypothetical protein
VPSGSLNSAGNIHSGGDITADGDVAAAGTVSGAAVSGVSVDASGAMTGNTGTFPAGLNSLDVHDREVITGRLSVWNDDTGQLGLQSSRRGVKKDLEPLTDTAALLSLTPYRGRYLTDADDGPQSVFLIAEDVAEAGFGPDVAPVDGDGDAFSVNYSQVVVPLLAVAKEHQTRLDEQQALIEALRAELDALRDGSTN